jgi:hypothetical protein
MGQFLRRIEIEGLVYNIEVGLVCGAWPPPFGVGHEYLSARRVSSIETAR